MATPTGVQPPQSTGPNYPLLNTHRAGMGKSHLLPGELNAVQPTGIEQGPMSRGPACNSTQRDETATFATRRGLIAKVNPRDVLERPITKVGPVAPAQKESGITDSAGELVGGNGEASLSC